MLRGLSQRRSDMVKSQQINTTDKLASFSAREVRTVVVVGGGGGHISMDLVGWHSSPRLQAEKKKHFL